MTEFSWIDKCTNASEFASMHIKCIEDMASSLNVKLFLVSSEIAKNRETRRSILEGSLSTISNSSEELEYWKMEFKRHEETIKHADDLVKLRETLSVTLKALKEAEQKRNDPNICRVCFSNNRDVSIVPIISAKEPLVCVEASSNPCRCENSGWMLSSCRKCLTNYGCTGCTITCPYCRGLLCSRAVLTCLLGDINNVPQTQQQLPQQQLPDNSNEIEHLSNRLNEIACTTGSIDRKLAMLTAPLDDDTVNNALVECGSGGVVGVGSTLHSIIKPTTTTTKDKEYEEVFRHNERRIKDKKKRKCHRCGVLGHYGKKCRSLGRILGMEALSAAANAMSKDEAAERWNITIQ
jgi:hypothetical protein